MQDRRKVRVISHLYMVTLAGSLFRRKIAADLAV